MFLQKTINQLDNQIPQIAPSKTKASLLAMVGLPGSGKSSVVRALHARHPSVVISTDGIRQQLLAQRTYSAEEVGQVYAICYALIERRLLKGQRVVFDASNYSMSRRNQLRDLTDRCQLPIAFCSVVADEEIIAKRLRQRMSSGRDAEDKSEADWKVYQWMLAAAEPIQGEFLTLDTSNLSAEAVTQQLLTYWQQIEARAQGNDYS